MSSCACAPPPGRGFGVSDLANGCFRRPGETEFRNGWAEIAGELEEAVEGAEYASLARCTQYAHYTPEFVIRAIWRGLHRLGFRGGRVLEPGMGTGLFASLMPEPLRAVKPCHRCVSTALGFQASNSIRGKRYSSPPLRGEEFY
jgi:hypothetical protein